jgi:hypothetical protein
LFAIPIVTAEPPIWKPREPEVMEIPEPTEIVEVETPKTPAPPLETKSCAEVGWLEVARPV